jgi:diguanylate cyclase (GGDEF)-like protein
MFGFWYKALPQYPRNHVDFWRVRLISNVMLIATVLFSLIAAVNLFAFSNYDLALLDFTGAVFAVGIYIWFRKTGQLVITSWMVVLVFTGLVLYFIYTVNGASNSFMWATLTPPIAFFLLGKNWGTFFTVGVLLFCSYIAFPLYLSQDSQTHSLGSVLNMLEVVIAHILLFRFYEGARSEAYSELRSNNQKIQLLAETDRLTGLSNREKLDQSLTEMISGLASETTPLAVLVIDIDHFKRINDEDGHLMGDKVLKNIAEKLQSKMRVGDLLARWGGEEFVVVLPDTTLNNAVELADRLREYIANQSIEGKSVTISIGVTECVSKDTAETFLGRADKALYRAKVGGRNQVLSASA